MSLINKSYEILTQLVPLFAALLIFLFTKHEFFIFLGMIALIFISFKLKYFRGEWKVLLFGIIVGFLFEIVADAIYKLQYWDEASLFGIPIWLPLMWGYGFVFIRRIGNIILRK